VAAPVTILNLSFLFFSFLFLILCSTRARDRRMRRNVRASYYERLHMPDRDVTANIASLIDARVAGAALPSALGCSFDKR
jgi:hypothetical protein